LPISRRPRPGHRPHRLGQIDHPGRAHRLHHSSYARHIIKIEEPIEFVHQNKLRSSRQREVGEDTPSFAVA